jgi:hypothetical protein
MLVKSYIPFQVSRFPVKIIIENGKRKTKKLQIQLTSRFTGGPTSLGSQVCLFSRKYVDIVCIHHTFGYTASKSSGELLMPNDLRNDLIDILEAVSKAQLRTLRRLRRSPRQEVQPAGEKSARSMSQIDMAYNILHTAGHPMHISEVIALTSKRYGVTLDRESIVSAITKRVARKDRFMRTGPNQFSVLSETER